MSSKAISISWDSPFKGKKLPVDEMGAEGWVHKGKKPPVYEVGAEGWVHKGKSYL